MPITPDSSKAEVLEAVEDDGLDLQYASKELQNNKEVVLVAVENDGDALQYASEELRDDEEVVRVAVKKCGYALKYTSERLQRNLYIVRTAIQHDPCALEYTCDALKNNPKLVLLALTKEIDQYTELHRYCLQEGEEEEGRPFSAPPRESVIRFIDPSIRKLMKSHRRKQDCQKPLNSYAALMALVYLMSSPPGKRGHYYTSGALYGTFFFAQAASTSEEGAPRPLPKLPQAAIWHLSKFFTTKEGITLGCTTTSAASHAIECFQLTAEAEPLLLTLN